MKKKSRYKSRPELQANVFNTRGVYVLCRDVTEARAWGKGRTFFSFPEPAFIVRAKGRGADRKEQFRSEGRPETGHQEYLREPGHRDDTQAGC
jgi:hypothetical protein